MAEPVTKNIHQRLAEAMVRVTYIQKERKTGMQYTIVSHDAVTAKVRPALLDVGIVYYPILCKHTHNGNRAECEMTVRFVNIDAPNDFFDVQTFGYGVDTQDKGPGKAMSYAMKYALLKELGLETGDDADHDSIGHSRADPAKIGDVQADARNAASGGKDGFTSWWKANPNAREYVKPIMQELQDACAKADRAAA